MSEADTALRESVGTWTPARPPLTHRQFCARTLLPGGPLKGTPYDPATDPVQNYFTEQLDSGRWRALFWAAPPQIGGKTQCAVLVPAMRAVIELKASCGYGLPTLNDLDRGWQTKVSPMIRDAGLGEYLPKHGPGSKQGRPPAISFEDPENDRAILGGFIFLAGSAKQVTCRVVVVDELDAWRNADGTPRWQDLEDVWSRADSFQSEAIRIGVGTVETDDPARAIVLAYVNEIGTGTRLWAKCPHCAMFAKLEFDAFAYEYRTLEGQDGPDLIHARSTAAYVCPTCAVRWSEDDRRAALQSAKFAHKGQTIDAAGLVHGQPPATNSFGLRSHALDSILTTQAEIAEKLAAARYALEKHGNHEPMRKFFRYQRVEHYNGDKQEEGERMTLHDNKSLADRSRVTTWCVPVQDKDPEGLYSRTIAQVPDGLVKLAASIDIQRNRLYWSIIGADAERLTFDIAWGYEFAQPADAQGQPPPYGPGELFALLNRAADAIDRISDGKITVGVADVSDGETQREAEQFLSARRGWYAIQGCKDLPAARQGNTVTHCSPLLAWDTRWRPGLGSYHIITDLAQQSVAAAYLIPPGKPGAGMLPGPLKSNDAYILHMTGTQWVKTTGQNQVWKKIRERNDHLDNRAYATAVLMHLLTKPTQPKPRPIGKIGSFI